MNMMKFHILKMIKLLFLFILFLNLNSNAQHKKIFNSCNDYITKRFYNNDTVLIKCDTSYIINSKTFNLYNELYIRFKSKDNMYSLIDTYEEQINVLNTDYSLLKYQYDSLYSINKKFIFNTNTKVNSIDTSFNKINSQLSDIKIYVNKNEIQNRNQKLIIGLSGISIGLLIGILFF